MRCAQTGEPNEMQFVMLSWVGPGNMYYTRIQMPLQEWALFGVSGKLKSIVKYRILGVG